MQPSEADGTGHPRRHGMAQCMWCETWQHPRRLQRVQLDVPASPLACIDTAWCDSTSGRRRPGSLPEVEGWDANGAPTGIDENGDAA